MINVLLTSLLILILVLHTKQLIHPKLLIIKGSDNVPTATLLTFIVAYAATSYLTYNFAKHVEDVNELKADNLNMIPRAPTQANFKLRSSELAAVKEQIKAAAEKVRFQVQITSLNGVSFYTLPMARGINNAAAGLGDIERGGAEKLKLLLSLIDYQTQIAHELVAAQRELIRNEVYQRNSKIMVLESSVVDGWLVRLLSIKYSAKEQAAADQADFITNL